MATKLLVLGHNFALKGLFAKSGYGYSSFLGWAINTRHEAMLFSCFFKLRRNFCLIFSKTRYIHVKHYLTLILKNYNNYKI